MSDRTTLTLVIADCPEHEAAALCAVFDRHALDQEFEPQPSDPLSVTVGDLRLHEEYVSTSIAMGTTLTLGPEIVAAAPHASWEMWEAPSSFAQGWCSRFTPELGIFTADCNADGTPVFSDQEISAQVNKSASDTALWLGLTHLAALAKFSPATASTP